MPDDPLGLDTLGPIEAGLPLPTHFERSASPLDLDPLSPLPVFPTRADVRREGAEA